MNNIFSIPKSEHTNFYDIARFNLTWRINIFLLLFLPILGTTLSLLNQISIIPTFISFFVIIVLLIIQKITKSFYSTAIIFSTVGTILCLTTLNFYPSAPHHVDTLWIIVIILFTLLSTFLYEPNIYEYFIPALLLIIN